MTNYFKILNPTATSSVELVFFNDEDPQATEAAFARALAHQRNMGGTISVYRRPSSRAIEGVAVIGTSR